MKLGTIVVVLGILMLIGTGGFLAEKEAEGNFTYNQSVIDQIQINSSLDYEAAQNSTLTVVVFKTVDYFVDVSVYVSKEAITYGYEQELTGQELLDFVKIYLLIYLIFLAFIPISAVLYGLYLFFSWIGKMVTEKK